MGAADSYGKGGVRVVGSFATGRDRNPLARAVRVKGRESVRRSSSSSRFIFIEGLRHRRLTSSPWSASLDRMAAAQPKKHGGNPAGRGTAPLLVEVGERTCCLAATVATVIMNGRSCMFICKPRDGTLFRR